MRVIISEGDISFCALYGADIRRFLSVLAAQATIGVDAQTGLGEANPFDEVQLHTAWGLLVFTFYSPEGKVTKAMNLELLAVTKDVVISDTGVAVDRYVRVVEELLRLAAAGLRSTPSAVSLIRPRKDVVSLSQVIETNSARKRRKPSIPCPQ